MKRTSLDEHIDKLTTIKMETKHPESLAEQMIKGIIGPEYWDVAIEELKEVGRYDFFKSIIRTYMGCYMAPEDKKRYECLFNL